MRILVKRVLVGMSFLLLITGCTNKPSPVISTTPQPTINSATTPTSSPSPSLAPEYDQAIGVIADLMELDRKYIFASQPPRPAFPEDEYAQYLNSVFLDSKRDQFNQYVDHDIYFGNTESMVYTLQPLTDEQREGSIAQVLACIDMSQMTVFEPGYPEYKNITVEMKYFLGEQDGALKVIANDGKQVSTCDI